MSKEVIELRASLDIFFCAKSKQFLIVNHGIDPLTKHRVSCGASVHISATDMQSRGLDLVLAELGGFERRDSRRPSELDRLPANEERRFYRNHKCVTVWQSSKEGLVVQAVEKFRGRPAVGKEDGRFALRLPTTNEAFVELLFRAIELAD